jgi:glycine/D-amino acid oxidase-like deaminating enzyme
MLLMLWPYHTPSVDAVFPPPIDPLYTDVVLRGLSTMIPGLAGYFDSAARPHVDGGYYTKTRENRPLIGPMKTPGTYVVGALSGYGIMAAPAAAELLSAHIVGSTKPEYGGAFSIDRYDDVSYQALLQSWPDTGQL